MPRLKRGMTAENAAASSRQISTFPRRKSVRAVDRNSPSSDERAQAMPGEGLTHGPPATKKLAAVTTDRMGGGWSREVQDWISDHPASEDQDDQARSH